MAVKRQKSWLGQQRVDVPHLREIESAIAADFDDLAGKILASSRPIVVHGMTISMGAAVGNQATQLVLNTASSILLHGTASEPGALFVVPSTQAAEVLSTSNPVVVGSFTPNTINYIGIDFIRLTDATTDDNVKFRSTSKQEFSQQVPLARTLQYRVIISPNDFSLQPNVAPVASVTLNASSAVVSVTDARELMFRLGSGGSVPNPLAVFAWPGGRTENPVTSTTTVDPFSGADKSIASFMDFFNAMESRLWEVGGGEHWYSQTTDRDVLFIRDAANVFAGGENFEWTGTNIHWRGIAFVFGNSTSTKNTITQQLVDSAGLTDLAVGDCIYVDLDRATNLAALTAHKATLAVIGTPTIPGSRHIIAWRTAEGVFTLGSVYPVGFAFPHATTTAYGVTKLFATGGLDAIVPAVDVNGYVQARGMQRDTAGELLIGGGTNDSSVRIGKAAAPNYVDWGAFLNQNIGDTAYRAIAALARSAANNLFYRGSINIVNNAGKPVLNATTLQVGFQAFGQSIAPGGSVTAPGGTIIECGLNFHPVDNTTNFDALKYIKVEWFDSNGLYPGGHPNPTTVTWTLAKTTYHTINDRLYVNPDATDAANDFKCTFLDVVPVDVTTSHTVGIRITAYDVYGASATACFVNDGASISALASMYYTGLTFPSSTGAALSVVASGDASGTCLNPAANTNPCTATTNNVTALPSGGTGPYTYAWTRQSGYNTHTPSAATSATTHWTLSHSTLADPGYLAAAVWRCTVTDSLLATAFVDINVQTYHINTM